MPPPHAPRPAPHGAISRARAHQIRHVVEAVYSKPWAITTAKLEEIAEVLDRRAAGLLSEAEIQGYLAAAGMPMDPDEMDQEDPSGKPYKMTAGGVAVLSLSGVLAQRMGMLQRISGGTSTEQFGQAFRQALKDPAVKAIVLDVNSPGGAVGGTAELSDLIFQSRAEKPIVAVSDTQMASAAYWIGSAAGEVVASPSSTTGSIGVYMVHSETSKLDQTLGRKRSVISAGRWKTIGNDAEPLTETTRGKLQEFVDSAYQLFLEAVGRNRGTSAERVRQGYGEGDVLFAKDAVAAGLVDRVATLQEVIDQLEARFAGQASGAAPSGGPTARDVQKAHLSKLKGRKMDPKLIAALFAKGLISEATEQAALAYFAARKEAPPADAAAAIQSLFTTAPAPAPKTEEKPAPASAAAPAIDYDALAAKIDERAAARAAREAEHLAKQTQAVCELMGLSAEDTTSIVAQKLPLDQARDVVRQKLAGGATPLARIEFTASEADTFGTAATQALEGRCMAAAGFDTSRDAAPGPAARDLVGLNMLQLAERCLRYSGVRTQNLSRQQIARLALGQDQPTLLASVGAVPFYGTASFTNLALNVMNKVLQRGYNEAPVTWRQWCRQGESIADFKQFSIVKFGEAGDLEMTPEGHDIPEDTGLSDSREYAVIEKFAKMVSITYEMLVNDDLGALTRLPRMQGTAAARTVNKAVYKILTGNPTMADTGALFNSTAITTAGGHANLTGTGSTTAAPPSVSTLQTMQALLRVQKGLNSDATLNLAVAYVIVPAALEATTTTLLRSQTDPAISNAGVPNVFYGLVKPVVEALLDANSAKIWYVAADPALIDTIAVHFLQGEETPFAESWWEPRNDSRAYKIRQSFAALAVDYRGLAEHTGYSA